MALYALCDDAQEALGRLGVGEDDLFDDVRRDIEAVTRRMRELVDAIRSVEVDKASISEPSLAVVV